MLVFWYLARERLISMRLQREKCAKREGGGTMKSTSGFTLLEIMLVVAIIGVLSAIAVPTFIKARSTAQQNACINNLRQIDSAKEQASLPEFWADGHDAPATIVNQYIKGNTTPVCPAGGTYNYEVVGTSPSCSFAGSTTHKILR